LAGSDPLTPTPRRRAIVAGLVLGAIVRAVVLTSPGTPDVPTWKSWSYQASTDVTGLYGVGGSPPERGVIRWRDIAGTTEYPPLALYEIAAVGRLYRAIDPGYDDSRLLTALIKLPGLVAELGAVVLLLTWGRRALGDAAAAWAALAIWLNPAIVINGAALGYLDAQMAMPAMLAFVAVAGGRPALAGVLAAAAVLTKAQALFIGPALLIAVWRQRHVPRAGALARFLAGGLALAAVVLAPIVLRGAWPNMIQALGRLGAHDMLSGYGLNAWWIVTWLVRSSYAAPDIGVVEAFTTPVRILQISRFIEVGYPNPKPLAALIVVALVAWGTWRRRGATSAAAWTALAGWSVFTYFTWNTQVHENHLYLAVPCLAVAAALEPRWRWLFWAVSFAAAFNMYLFYGLGDGWPPLVDRRWTWVDLSVFAAAVNAALWAIASRRL
jgi:hypothetical protein